MTRILFLLSVFCFFTGCTTYKKQIPTGSPMAVDNVFAKPGYDHSKILSLLLLPVNNPRHIPEVDRFHDELVDSVLRNFGKFNYFSLQTVPHPREFYPPVVDTYSGRIDRARLGEIGQTYGAQAVLQIDVEEYRPFAPMRLQVRGTIVDASSGERVWQFHHTFDSDDADVINSMRIWWNSRVAGGDERSAWFELGQVRPSVYSNFVFYTMARSYERSRVMNIEAIEAERDEQDEIDEEVEKLQAEATQSEKRPRFERSAE